MDHILIISLYYSWLY